MRFVLCCCATTTAPFSTGAKETVYNTEKTHVSGGKGEPSMHLKRVALTKGDPSQWYCLIEFFVIVHFLREAVLLYCLMQGVFAKAISILQHRSAKICCSKV